MGKRRRGAPVWVQALISWVVLTFFTGGGLLYLRATGTFSDGVFAPYARVLCDAGSRIETSYDTTKVYTGSLPNRRFVGNSFLMNSAECVGQDGSRRAINRFDFVVMLPFAVAWAVLLAWSARRANRRGARSG